jgi:hypothetical protein
VNQDLAPFDAMSAEVTLLVKPIYGLKVTDPDSEIVAAEHLRKLRILRDSVEAKRKELTAPLRERERAINDYAERLATPIRQAEAALKDEAKAYKIEVERKIREERERLEREERERVAEEARKRREAQEAAEARRREEERVAREKADAIQKERDEAAAKAAKARSLFKTSGMAVFDGGPQVDEAAALRERHEKERLEEQARAEREESERKKAFEAEQRRLEALKPKGLRTDWDFEVQDASQVPREYLMVDEKALRFAVVGRGLRQIPGVRIFEKRSVVSR